MDKKFWDFADKLPTLDEPSDFGLVEAIDLRDRKRRGTTYFVDEVDGDDSNDGLSWESAFKTTARANAATETPDYLTDNSSWGFQSCQFCDQDKEPLVWSELAQVHNCPCCGGYN